jgi:hypothetical protein
VTDSREERHIVDADQQYTPFFLDSEMFRRWPFARPDLQWPPIALPKPPKVERGGPEELHREVQHFLYFTGSDLWPHWAFAHVGALWSPGGLDNEGFTLKLLLNAGAYRYVSGTLTNSTVLGIQSSITAMPGWRFKFAATEITVYAGVDLQQFRYVPDDPGASLRGRQIGMRGGFELWHEPTATTMFAADASISSIRAGNSARAAYGWRVFDSFYLGPEAQLYYSEPYLHRRVGMHITAFKHEDREWSGAIGYGSDSDHRSGLYIRIGVLVRQ